MSRRDGDGDGGGTIYSLRKDNNGSTMKRQLGEGLASLLKHFYSSLL